MTTVIIRPKGNTLGKKDFTGAFKPESEAFMRTLAGSYKCIEFDNLASMHKRFEQVSVALDQFEGSQEIETLAVFCHGWHNGIQAGLTTKNLPELLAEHHHRFSPNVRILLYCCSTGWDPHDSPHEAPGGRTLHVSGVQEPTAGNLGEGSFADKLRDLLCEEGSVFCRVTAHRTVGHTTKNPNVIVFNGGGSPYGGNGGFMPVSPGNRRLWAAWKRMLRGKKKQWVDFRFRFPFLDGDQLQLLVRKEAGL